MNELKALGTKTNQSSAFSIKVLNFFNKKKYFYSLLLINVKKIINETKKFRFMIFCHYSEMKFNTGK